ncbi:MAG: PAS domain S-box protein, partial [Candidatus Omnitrophica bacterium]|nr:PAS domain S-box protein [Candidatus Omnitrophota bacterium]
VLGECICLYSREEKDKFKVIEGVNLPSDFPLFYPKEGTPYSEVISKEAIYPLVIDVENSPYRDNEIIRKMGIKTYLGTFVGVEGKFKGVLCAFFKEKKEFTPFQLYITAILSQAIQNEEEIQNEEKKRLTQERLIKAYEMSKHILDQTPFGVYIVNKEGKVEYANQAMLDISGDTKETFMSLDVFNIEMHKRIGLDRKIKDCLNGSYFKLGPLEYTSLSGKTTVKNFVGIPLKEDGEEKAIVVVEDLTEEKQMEKELEKRTALIESIIENAHSIILVVDKEGNILTVNRFLENITGYSREEILGKNWCDIFIPSSFQEQVRKAFKQALAGRIFRSFQVPIFTKDKRELEISWDSSVLKDTQDSVSGLILFGYDITEKKKIEHAQRLARLGELVSDMAHEVNNPLMIISGRAQLALMEEIKNAEIEKALRVIVEESQRAKDIIQRLLLFSKPSKGEVKEVDINECIEEVVELIEHQFFLRNVKIVKKYKPLPKIKVDEKQIQEVIMNLLKNSYDAMQGGGTITISTFPKRDKIKIEIADTGEGMSEEVLAKIFEPFFTTKEQGTGLGLSLCYGIIKAHNGNLQFESALGKGTKAIISLPLK